MKKQLFAWMLVFLSAAGTVSCSQDEPAPEVLDYAEPTYKAPTRSTEAVIAIAEAAVSQEATKGRAQRTVSSKNAVRPIVSHKSRTEADTLLYVVQYDDNQGFAVISASKCVEPVIAVIDDGAYDSYETMTNEPFQAFMADAQQYAATKSGSGLIIPPPDPIIPKPITPAPIYFYDDTIKPTPKTTPSVTVRWGQSWPENMYAPNKVAGCVPVAIAQILSVFKTPMLLPMTFPEKKGITCILSWNDMLQHRGVRLTTDAAIESHLSNCYAAHEMIGYLVRQIGVDCKASYNADNTTGASYKNAINCIKSYLPNKGYKEWNNTKQLFNDLVNKTKPIAFVTADNSNDNSGHAWVADGTWSIGTTIKQWVWNEKMEVYDLQAIIGHTDYYIHYNWGWNGSGNGFFLTSVLSPQEAYEYDEWYDFNAPNYSYKNIKYTCIY